MTRVFSYVLRYDYGFAPNPFHGSCTLATCKPDVREHASVGDWVIGTGSVPKGYGQHLIYAMQVSEKLTFDEYWADSRFQYKKPDLSGALKARFGDNIYHFDTAKNQWVQSDSHHSLENGRPNVDNIKRDTKTNNILVGERFVYYGKEAPRIPDTIAPRLCVDRRGTKSRFSESFVHEVVAWLESLSGHGFCGEPIDWQADIRRGYIALR